MSRRKESSKTPESQLLSLVMDYLAAHRYLAFRQNTGMMNMGGRVVRFGVAGMADILVFVTQNEQPFPVWLELKSEDGRVSSLQKSFREQVESHGHRYAIVRSLDDAMRALETP